MAEGEAQHEGLVQMDERRRDGKNDDDNLEEANPCHGLTHPVWKLAATRRCLARGRLSHCSSAFPGEMSLASCAGRACGPFYTFCSDATLKVLPSSLPYVKSFSGAANSAPTRTCSLLA